MTKTTVAAKLGDSDKVSVEYDFGDTLEEMSKKFTSEVVASNAKAAMTVALQDLIRAGIKAGKANGAIQKEAAAWVPGVKRRGKTKAEKLADLFSGLDPEEKKALLARMSK